MPSTKSIVQNIIIGSDICCLCLNQTDNDEFIRMDDEVLLSANHKDSVFFVDMLSVVINKDMNLQSTITMEVVCNICAKSVIDYYKFVTACKENAARLSNILNNLTETFTQSTFNSKAVILSMESNSLQCELYLESKPLCDRGSALKRLKRKKKEMKAQKKVIDIYTNYENFADNNDYQCKSCLKLFSCTKALRAHIKRIHAPKDYNCDVCYKKFGFKHLLKNHKKSTHLFVICSECGKSYNNLYSLKMHEATHNLSHLSCQNCGKSYRSKQYYQQHINSKACSNNKFRFKHLSSEEKLECTLCDKGFANKSGLKAHVRSFHDVEAALTCTVCSKPFSSQSRLNDHMVKHTKEKKFDCNVCGGKFVSKPSLLYHTRIHTGETPFACPQCPMKFLSASRRIDHMRRFHWEPMLACVYCNTKFKTCSALSKHKKRHLNPNSKIYVQKNPAVSGS